MIIVKRISLVVLFLVAAVVYSMPRYSVPDFVAGYETCKLTAAEGTCTSNGVDACVSPRVKCLTDAPAKNVLTCEDNAGTPACQDDPDECVQDEKHATRDYDCEQPGS